MNSRNNVIEVENRIKLRVGIHVGDVISKQDGDILGDAVNISSRIEQFAFPGGVCISEQVFAQVNNKVNFRFVRVESQKLKNVDLPMDLYRIVMPWEEAPAKQDTVLEARRVAVLPFKNMSPDPNDEYFADGLTEEMIASLSSVKELTVIARTSVMQYRAVSKRVTEIGKELNAGTLIEGSIRKAGNRIRVTVQMIDAQKDGHLWAQNYDRNLDDIFAIQTDIAERVTKELRIHLIPEVKTRLEAEPTTPEAYTLYLKGRFFWNERTKEAVFRAIEYFGLAIKKDPNFALGYAGLASCYQVIARNSLGESGPNYEKGREYAMKALELDPDLPEAHAVLGGYLTYYAHDWKGAEAELQRAIVLKPSYSTAHQWYSHVLAQTGRILEALEEVRRAIELDPFSPVINENYANGLFFQREYEKAIEQYRKVLDLDPSRAGTYPLIVQTYCALKKFDAAWQNVEAMEKISKQQFEVKLAKAYVLACTSRGEEARKLLKEIEGKYEMDNISPFDIGVVYFLLGDTNAGFGWLDRAYESHDGNVNLLLVVPEFDGVRSDPRYLEMVKRIGLSAA